MTNTKLILQKTYSKVLRRRNIMGKDSHTWLYKESSCEMDSDDSMRVVKKYKQWRQIVSHGKWHPQTSEVLWSQQTQEAR